MMGDYKAGFGYWSVLSLSIGSIVGTTLFLGVGIGARLSGNLLLVAWLLMSILALYVAACFGELASTFPKAGGAYEYAKHAYGRFFSFIIGWVSWLFGNLAVVVMIVGATGFLFAGLDNLFKFLISLGIIVLLNAIAYLGVQASSIMLTLFAVIIVAVPVLVIAKGLPAISLQNFIPFATHPWSTVVITAFFFAESYFGWESATYLAEETRNPRKTIPKALMHATLIISAIGLLLMITLLGTTGWEQLATKAMPFAEVAAMLFGENTKLLVGIGTFLALVGSAASGIVALPRLVLALARDKLFLGQFKAMHHRFNTPHNAIIFQAVILLLLLILGFADYEILLSMLVPMGVFLYVALLVTVPMLRSKYPTAERPFKVIIPKVGVTAAILVLLATVVSWGINVDGAMQLLELTFYLIAIGVPLYFLVELYYDPKMITQVNDIFAYLTLLTERVTFTRRMKRELFTFLGDLNGRTILEFGCGVGTLTVELARRIGLKGKVYATHFSKNNLKITSKQVDDLRWTAERPIGHVELIYDGEMFRRIYPEITYADCIVSIGMLSYVQDMKTVLKEMWAILPLGGKLCFTDYTDFFHVIPNVEWLSSEDEIEKLFRSAGFSVRVVKIKSILWNRIFIYGVKTKERMTFI